jgi:hypothetical protein
MTADELFRRFEEGKIGVPEMLEQAKNLPPAQFTRLVELMLQHGFPEGEPDDDPPA